MILDDLLGRVFETVDGTRVRFVGFDPQAGTARLRTLYRNTIGGETGTVPLELFRETIETGALREIEVA